MSIILGESKVPYIGDSQSTEIEYKNWMIWVWDNDDKRRTEYIQQPELKDVVTYCKLRQWKKYSIFDDNNRNGNNDGINTLLG
jgi:hypothetical protein